MSATTGDGAPGAVRLAFFAYLTADSGHTLNKLCCGLLIQVRVQAPSEHACGPGTYLPCGVCGLCIHLLSLLQDRDGPKALDEFCRDLCEEVRQNKIDPVIGREREVARVMQILARRTKNNPILLGEPGELQRVLRGCCQTSQDTGHDSC